MMDIQIKGKKSEKVWREFCEDCGCPLEVCCKPKKPVVEVEWLKFQITCIKHDYSNIETGFNELLKDIENRVAKKNE